LIICSPSESDGQSESHHAHRRQFPSVEDATQRKTLDSISYGSGIREFLPFLDNLNAESPRGCALIAAGYLEELLKRVLLGFMRDVKEAEALVEGGNAPLGTFSARIQACFALGLIEDEEYQELVLIRRIRNELAHNAKASFDDPVIASRCQELKYRAPGDNDP